MSVVIPYKQVFGVDLGQEVQEAHGVNYTASPAAASSKQLFKTAYYTQNASKVGGVGPLFVDWGHGVLKHEYNRHHAGLAVDIMLSAKANEIPLGHALVLAFNRLATTMKWRSIIYQNVTINLNGNGSALRAFIRAVTTTTISISTGSRPRMCVGRTSQMFHCAGETAIL